MGLKGALRKKFEKNIRRTHYPSFLMREPRLLVMLPRFKDITKVDVKYPLLEPFTYVHIKYDPKEKKLFYNVVEPKLSGYEIETLEKLKEMLTETIDVKIPNVKDRSVAINYIQKRVTELLNEMGLTIPPDMYINIMYYIVRDFVGLNEIEPIMHDPYIEDIGCSGAGIPVYVIHRKFGSLETNVVYHDFDYLSNYVIKLSERCGRYISYATPLLDGTLPEGSRIQASLSKDVTTKGPTFSIRKFRRNPLSPIDILNLKTASPEIMAYMWLLIDNATSMLVCGGVASGKTTMLNVLSMFIPPEEKIVSIEDVREINIVHENWIPSTTRVGFGVPDITGKKYGEIELFDLLKESFRMKPDYVIVGEVRGKEAYVMFQGMASGNPSMGTIHAGSMDDVIKRLETQPIDLSPSLIEALDVIIVMVNAKEKGKSARRIKEIAEIQKVDKTTGNAHTIKTFAWIPSTDTFKSDIARSEVLRKISFEKGIPYNKIIEDFENRKKIMEWMKRHRVIDFEDVASIISRFHKDKTNLMSQVERDMAPDVTSERIKRPTLESATGLRTLGEIVKKPEMLEEKAKKMRKEREIESKELILAKSPKKKKDTKPFKKIKPLKKEEPKKEHKEENPEIKKETPMEESLEKVDEMEPEKQESEIKSEPLLKKTKPKKSKKIKGSLLKEEEIEDIEK